MSKSIELPESLYDRLGGLAAGFETPANVIERLLDIAEATKGVAKNKDSRASPVMANNYGKLEINLFPYDAKQFKTALLIKKQAWVKLYKKDGSIDIHQWNARQFSESSNVLGNLRSGYLRDWREKGIVRADISINREDITDS